ncbi:hypothetical protein [Mucisphaera calidilacus]|uniref:Uncharacterized protein n=1 Tax=Mucisphaera calidilacus TaxID=2527982 RepID=A0A518BZE6_9BACT|nr:hypothetical protein [Mucisphaera calidilacus]QDU72335.1 hypothetical protein Pan265_22000 [Mucisphaera calidilacus]
MSERLEQLKKLQAMDPSDPFLTYGIAMEYEKADDPAEVVIWLDRTLALDGNYLYAYFQKARALSSLGEETEAVDAAREGYRRAQLSGDEKAVEELRGLMLELGEALEED